MQYPVSHNVAQVRHVHLFFLHIPSDDEGGYQSRGAGRTRFANDHRLQSLGVPGTDGSCYSRTGGGLEPLVLFGVNKHAVMGPTLGGGPRQHQSSPSARPPHSLFLNCCPKETSPPHWNLAACAEKSSNGAIDLCKVGVLPAVFSKPIKRQNINLSNA